MCGIAGQARADRVVPGEALLAAMCARIEHRGPDSRGAYLDRGVALGIQRLAVIDLETGDQPVFNEDRSVSVVLNGEIYNFSQLRSELSARGHRFTTAGDTEVIAHLYEERGPELVHDLDGMFAFALWDAARERLLLARDRFGKKPLFYAVRAGVLTFASELQALLEDGDVDRTPDAQALDAFLTLGYVPDPACAFGAVRKLPPAHRLSFEGGRERLDRYWQLGFEPKLRLSERELDERLRSHLRSAVEKRMVADVPVGAFLSGGVDSAAVVAAMVECSLGQVRTFSIGFEGEPDELPAARLTAARLGTDHTEARVSPDAAALLPQIVRHHGEPFGDVTAIPMFYLSEVARREVTVALTGDGGDELFGGYTRYATNLRLERLPRGLAPALTLAHGLLGSSARVDTLANRVARLERARRLGPVDRYLSYVSQLDGDVPQSLYTREYAAHVHGCAGRAALESAWPDGGDLLERMLAADVATYLPGDLLAKADVASMARSLELRSPLLDHRLAEFAASLPSDQKVRGGEKKIALRRVLRGRVPAEILAAPKRGFHPPLAAWLRGPLAPHAKELLLDSRARTRGHFDPGRVAAMLASHTTGRRDHSPLIWRLMVWETWHREFLDATPSRRAPVFADA